MHGSAGRGQQPRKTGLSVMAMTRRAGEEAVLAFPLSERRAFGDCSAHKYCAWLCIQVT
ncbi:UNVERIFIED_CONTAM: hypothetical protein FKN15_012130 [Acipenser sinensis]